MITLSNIQIIIPRIKVTPQPANTSAPPIDTPRNILNTGKIQPSLRRYSTLK